MPRFDPLTLTVLKALECVGLDLCVFLHFEADTDFFWKNMEMGHYGKASLHQ